MALYASFTPYLLVSDLPDRSTNSLAAPSTETFTVTKVIEDFGRTMTANYGQVISYDLTSWTSISEIRVTNTGATVLEVDWNSSTDAGPGTDTFAYVPAGRTLVIPSAYPDTAIYAFAGSVLVWCADLALPGSADIVILGT